MAFSVLSYNILADVYIDAQWYPQTPPDVLRPSNRRPALVQHIAGMGADVICLQEVELDVLDAIESSMRPMGYVAHYAQKGAGKRDGCATLVRSAAFRVLESQVIHYADAAPGRCDSGHVALVLNLGMENRVVGIANTHLKWDPPRTPTAECYGPRQIAALMSDPRFLALRRGPRVVCGDLNVLPDGDVIAVLRSAGFESAFREPQPTCVAHGRAQTVDYIFHTPDLVARPAKLPMISDNASLPSTAEPSDHLPIMAWFDHVACAECK
jgi:mRNA deadenylase 3'-5' endonuclease subunit Ccr4